MSKISKVHKEIRGLPDAKRIELAKAKLEKLMDHFLYVLRLHANNKIVTYSPALADQIPTSHAAHAFNAFQLGLIQIEIVRICAIWDGIDPQKENIPTVVELIDKSEIIDELVEVARSHYHGLPPPRDFSGTMDDEAGRAILINFGNDQAAKVKAGLTSAIADARAIMSSGLLSSVMNLRDKQLAHSLEKTYREANGPVPPMKYGDETALLNRSIPILEQLRIGVSGIGFDFADSQRIDDENAAELWTACKFTIER